MEKELKKEYFRKIISSRNFNEALMLKNDMMNHGIQPSKDVYYQLMQKCSNYQSALELKKEIEDFEIPWSEELFISYIRKLHKFDEKLQIIEEMQLQGVYPSIKTFHTIIKYELNFKKALFAFNKMKQNNIEPDRMIYAEIVKKALGESEYKSLKREQKDFEEMEDYSTNIPFLVGTDCIINQLIEDNKIIDNQYIRRVLMKLSNSEERKSILISAMENGLKINANVCWEFIQQTAKDYAAHENKTFVSLLKAKISDKELRKLHEKFKIQLGKVGGHGKYKIEISNLVDDLNQEAMTKDVDDPLFYYLLGKAYGLEVASNKKRIFSQEEEMASDYDFYKFETEKIRGIKDGILAKRDLMSALKRKKIPMVVLVFIETEELKNLLFNLSLEEGFYPYELEELKKGICSSGIFITNKIEEFKAAAEQIDYDKCDASLNFFCEQGSANFYGRNPLAEEWINRLYSHISKKAINPNFIVGKAKRNERKRLTAILMKLYKDVTFSSES
ncbi:hypothetical protein ACFVHQ_19410 [Actinomycetes bacterium NPDC127524]